MKKLRFLFLCVFILSCTKENTKNTPTESSKSDRLLFKDCKEYSETSMMLSKMTSITDLQIWAQEKGHSTLLFDEDTTLSNYSPSLKTILNKDSEFQLGDSIVWFHSGNFYTYAKNSNVTVDLKANPELYKRSGYVTSSKISSSSKGNLYEGGNCPLVTGNFNQTHYVSCDGLHITNGTGTRKWVAELRDQTSLIDYSYWESTLWLVLKLEWKGSGGWAEASEERDVHYNINGTVSFHNNGQSIPMVLLHTSGVLTCANGHPVSYNLWIPESIMSPYSHGEGVIYWAVSLNGQSTQHILGNPPQTLDPYTQTLHW